MTDRKSQPAQLKHRIRLLEAQLEAEKERCERAWSGYRDALYELTAAKIKLEDVRKALNGDD